MCLEHRVQLIELPAFVHSMVIVHRDIKASSFCFESDRSDDMFIIVKVLPGLHIIVHVARFGLAERFILAKSRRVPSAEHGQFVRIPRFSAAIEFSVPSLVLDLTCSS